MGCCGGRAQIRGPWQGQGFIKWVLSESVRKYDGLWRVRGLYNGFVQPLCFVRLNLVMAWSVNNGL